LSGLSIGLVLAAVFAASAISGLLGMAGGSLLMAVLTLILPVSAALALHGAAQLASNLARAGLNARHVRYRPVGWFGLGAVVGMALLSFVAFQPSKAAVFIGMGFLPILAGCRRASSPWTPRGPPTPWPGASWPPSWRSPSACRAP
jgi:uncharacterized membrane protein YfcA